MKFNSLIVIALLALGCVHCLDVNISNRNPHCFFVDLGNKETLVIQYEVTGYKADEFRMSVYEAAQQNGQPLHVIQKEKTASYNLFATEPKEYKVCFQSLDNSGKILQFEFIRADKTDEAYADDKTLQKVHADSLIAQSHMVDIYANLRHQLMRTEMQTKILESTENKVKWCSVIKMVLMISITTIQILFLTGLFKDTSSLGI